MASAVSPKESEVYFKIFGIYKKSEHLWNKKNINYGDESMTLEAFKRLLEIYREFDPDATVEILKSKINNMMSAYRRELKKVKKSVESGTTPKYVPCLWYYDYLTFLPETSDSDNSDEEILLKEEPTSSVSMKKVRRAVKENKEKVTSLDNKIPQKTEEKRKLIAKLFTLELQGLDDEQFNIVNKLMSDIFFFAKAGKLTVTSSINLGHQ